MMTFPFMRRIDDIVGMPLARLLGLLLRFKHRLSPPRRARDRSQVTRILVQKYFGMGSILHSIPLITVLRRNYPNARIIFLTSTAQREIASLCGIADEVIVADFRSIPRFLASFVRIAAALLSARFDVSIDLEFFARFPLLVSALSGADVRVGLHLPKTQPDGILTHKVMYNCYRHISETYLAYAAQLDLTTDQSSLSPVLPSFRPELEGLLRNRFELGQTDKIVVVNVNVGDLFAFRKWPGSHYSHLLSLLGERHPDHRFLLIGSAGQFDYIEEVRRNAGPRENILNCAGRTSLRELFALIEMSSLVISNDSGPMHIASCYKKNIAAFFGPETPIVYGPINKNALVFQPKDLYCSPCIYALDNKRSLYADTCVRNECMLSLRPEEAFHQLEARFFGTAAVEAPDGSGQRLHSVRT